MDFLLQNLVIFSGLIILAFLSWRKSEYGIYAIIFSLPLYLIKLEIFGVPTTFLELSIYILFIIRLLEKKSLQDFLDSLKALDKKLKIGIVLLLAGAIVSTIFSSDLRTSVGILKGWFFDPLLFFVVLTSVIKTAEQKENVLKSFFSSGLAVAAISLIYWLAPWLDGVSYDNRLHAFYLSPNYLAMYLAPALIIGIWLMVLGKNRRYGAVAVFVIAFALYLTFSYAAWISLFIAISLLICFLAQVNKKPSFQWKLGFLSGKRFNLQKKIFAAAAVFLVFAVATLSQLGTAKLDDLKNLSYRSSLNSRLMIWRAAWEIGKDNPLVGIGPGNFQRYYLDYQKRFIEPYLEWAAPEPHNIFLAFWLQTGILGLAGFITLIFWFFKKIFNLFKKVEDAGFQGLVIVLCSIMVYTLLHGLVDTTYWKNDLAIIFWMVLGLAAAAESDTSKIF